MKEHWPLSSAEDDRREVERRCGVALADRLAAVELVVLDCDGVMTDARLYFGPSGEVLKTFDARDGLGLMMLHAARVARAVLTGRRSAMVARRCEELRFQVVKMGRFDKIAALAEIQRETGVAPEHTLYVGDDLLDLPTLAAAGVAVTVPHAPADVKAACDLVTEAAGGRGAVREVCDLILMARGDRAGAIQRLAAGGSASDDPEVTH